MGFDIKVSGLATVAPLLKSSMARLSDGIGLDLVAKYAAVDGAYLPSIGASPVTLSLGGSTVVRLLILRSVDPTNPVLAVSLKTAAAGPLQIFPLSDLLLLHNPVAGSEVMQLVVTGPGGLEFLVAGS